VPEEMEKTDESAANSDSKKKRGAGCRRENHRQSAMMGCEELSGRGRRDVRAISQPAGVSPCPVRDVLAAKKKIRPRKEGQCLAQKGSRTQLEKEHQGHGQVTKYEEHNWSAGA